MKGDLLRQKVKSLKLWHMTFMGLFSGLSLHRCHYLNRGGGEASRGFHFSGLLSGMLCKGQLE